jgi:hypothetical protein
LQGKYLGFTNELDVMRTLGVGIDLSKLKAEEIMRKDRFTLTVYGEKGRLLLLSL